LLTGALGLALSTVGLDPFRAEPRFTFAQLSLWDGLGLLPVALGVFAIPEALAMIRSRRLNNGSHIVSERGVLRGMGEAVRQIGLVWRCSALGAAIGMMPGVGAAVSQWIAYAYASRRSRGSHAFGSGAIEGVIGPAAATTATHSSAMVPTLALGIPGGLSSSFLLSALILKGLAPGPAMLRPTESGGYLTLVFALIWCTVLASAVGALIGMASVPWVSRLANVRPARLVSLILAIVLIGTVGERHAPADLGILLALGCLGFSMSALSWPRAPLMLGFVLGPLVERRVTLSSMLYGWSWIVRPGVLIIATGVIAFVLMSRRSRRHTGHIKPAPRDPARADLVLCAFFIALSLAGLGLSLSLTGRASFFPRVAFGLTLGLSLLQLSLSYRRGAFARRLPHGRNRADDIARIVWLATFVANAWFFGLVIGITASTFIYLRWDARESWRTTFAMSATLGGLTWALVVHVLQLSDRGLLLS
jgi:hypothetical protein